MIEKVSISDKNKNWFLTLVLTSLSADLYYPHKDYLGSLLCLTDESGNEVQRYSFDAWGHRRNPTNWNQWQKDSTHIILNRGFTGHVCDAHILQGEAAGKYVADTIPPAERGGKHMDYFGLIIMSNEVRSRTLFMSGNGRVYDPNLGRFLSPDPYVQMPDNSQNFNRYSYVLNNPLIYTDPSGLKLEGGYQQFEEGLTTAGAIMLNLDNRIDAMRANFDYAQSRIMNAYYASYASDVLTGAGKALSSAIYYAVNKSNSVFRGESVTVTFTDYSAIYVATQEGGCYIEVLSPAGGSEGEPPLKIDLQDPLVIKSFRVWHNYLKRVDFEHPYTGKSYHLSEIVDYSTNPKPKWWQNINLFGGMPNDPYKISGAFNFDGNNVGYEISIIDGNFDEIFDNYSNNYVSSYSIRQLPDAGLYNVYWHTKSGSHSVIFEFSSKKYFNFFLGY